MLFSLGNLYIHLKGMEEVRRRVHRDNKLRNWLLMLGMVQVNTWVWSAVFHTRGKRRVFGYYVMSPDLSSHIQMSPSLSASTISPLLSPSHPPSYTLYSESSTTSHLPVPLASQRPSSQQSPSSSFLTSPTSSPSLWPLGHSPTGTTQCSMSA